MILCESGGTKFASSYAFIDGKLHVAIDVGSSGSITECAAIDIAHNSACQRNPCFVGCACAGIIHAGCPTAI